MSIYCTGCQCCVHMWPLPAVVKEMERPCRLCLGNPFRSQVSACSFQGYRPGKIIKWPTNPHKCSQFQFGEIMIQIFTSQQKNKQLLNAGDFCKPFFWGGWESILNRAALIWSCFFFPWWTEQGKKKTTIMILWLPCLETLRNGPWIFYFCRFRCWQTCYGATDTALLARRVAMGARHQKESVSTSAQGHSQVKILWNMENKSADEPTFAHQL